jgi:hypothetical protein
MRHHLDASEPRTIATLSPAPLIGLAAGIVISSPFAVSSDPFTSRATRPYSAKRCSTSLTKRDGLFALKMRCNSLSVLVKPT